MKKLAMVLGAAAMVLGAEKEVKAQAPTQATRSSYMVGDCQLYVTPASRYTIELISYDPETKVVQGRAGAVVDVGLYCPVFGQVWSFPYTAQEIPPEHGNQRGWGWTMPLEAGMDSLNVRWGGGAFTITFNVLPAAASQDSVDAVGQVANQALKKAEEGGDHHLAFLFAALPPLDGDKRFGARFEGTIRFRKITDTFRPFAGLIFDYNQWQVLKAVGVPNVHRPEYENWNAETFGFQATAGLVVNLPPYVEIQGGVRLGDWFTRYPAGVISQTQEGSVYGIPVTDFHACAWGFDVGVTGKPLPWFGIRVGYSFGRNCTRMPVTVGPQREGGYLANHDFVAGMMFTP